MTRAAALARMARHRLGDAAIALGVRLTHDAAPAMSPAQSARIAAAVEAGRAVLAAGREAEARNGAKGVILDRNCRGR